MGDVFDLVCMLLIGVVLTTTISQLVSWICCMAAGRQQDPLVSISARSQGNGRPVRRHRGLRRPTRVAPRLEARTRLRNLR
jgi:hypothetical protein